MPDLTAQQMADAADAIQLGICSIIHAELPTVKDWPRWVQDNDREAWGRLLENANGDIDAFTVQFAGMTHPPVETLPAGDVAPQLIYVIDFFHGFELGDDEANSGKTILANVMRAMFALSVKTDLDLRQYVKRHNHLSAPPQAEITAFGDRLSHWIPTSLTVQMQSFYTRG